MFIVVVASTSSKWSGLSVLSCEEAFGLLSVNGLDRIVVSACKN